MPKQYRRRETGYSKLSRATQRRFGTDVDLENITSIARRTWQKYRLQNRGPNFYLIGGTVRYDFDEVLEWIKLNSGDHLTSYGWRNRS
jgi:hypothetical protein